MIKQLCYDLFIIDWKTRISKERELKSMRSYYRDIEMQNVGGVSYNDYVLDHGYDGELYPYFDEFLDIEYLDKAYMCELLEDKDLIKMYLNDIAIMETEGRLVGTANYIGHTMYRLEIGHEYILEKVGKDLDTYWVNAYDMEGNFIIKATLPCFKDVKVLEG